MPRQREYEEDDWDEEYDPSQDGDDEPTIVCPYCKADIHEDSVQCPRCRNYLSDEDAPVQRKPWWIIIGTLACLFVIYRWIVG